MGSFARMTDRGIPRAFIIKESALSSLGPSVRTSTSARGWPLYSLVMTREGSFSFSHLGNLEMSSGRIGESHATRYTPLASSENPLGPFG